jgi:hypothetical protein
MEATDIWSRQRHAPTSLGADQEWEAGRTAGHGGGEGRVRGEGLTECERMKSGRRQAARKKGCYTETGEEPVGRPDSYVAGGSTGLYDTSDGKDEEGVSSVG